MQYLIRGSFENTGTLIDGVSQQAVLLTLQLLCSPVQRFGDRTSLRDVALERTEEKKKKKKATRMNIYIFLCAYVSASMGTEVRYTN